MLQRLNLTLIGPILILILALSGSVSAATALNCTVFGEKNAFSQTQELLLGPQSTERALLLRFLPQMKRKEAVAESLTLLEQERTAPLKKALILGMGQTTQAEYIAPLMRKFPELTPDLQEAVARSLGRLGGKQALPVLEDYLRQSFSWYAKARVTEEVIIAIGRLSSTGKTAELFYPLIEPYLRSPEEMALRFGADPERDRLFGAIAFALDDLARSAQAKTASLNLYSDGPWKLYRVQYPSWIQNLYASKSPYASVRAAKVLLKNPLTYKSALPEPQEYLKSILNNPSLSPEARLRAGLALVDGRGVEGLNDLESASPNSMPIYLGMIHELGPRHWREKDVEKLMSYSDPAFVIEGALGLAQFFDAKKGANLLQQLEKGSLEEKSPVAKAALRYACEEATSPVTF